MLTAALLLPSALSETHQLWVGCSQGRKSCKHRGVEAVDSGVAGDRSLNVASLGTWQRGTVT